MNKALLTTASGFALASILACALLGGGFLVLTPIAVLLVCMAGFLGGSR